jgi:hypothetical protein
MNTTEILEAINAALVTLTEEHAGKFKNSPGKARKAAKELKTLAADYQRVSNAESKAAK